VSGARREGPAPSPITAAGFLAEVVARHGERPALRLPDEARELSYRELGAEARRLARGLVGAGVGKGTRVALLLGNRPEWAVAWLAAGLVGAVLVPVNTFATPEEIDWILRHGDAALLLLQPGLAGHRYLDGLLERHPELAGGEPGRIRCLALPALRGAFCLGLDARRGAVESWARLGSLGEDVSEALLDALAAEVTPGDDALLIYTSGTTERPKGILHRQRAAFIQSWRFAELMGLGPEDRVLTSQPFFWTAGIAMSLGATLAAGACLVLQEVFEPGRALALIEAEAITALHAWPHQEKALGEHPDAARRDLSRLRKIRFSSLLARRVGLVQDLWGIDASYGLSETFTLAAALPADTPAAQRARSSGRPLPGVELRIVDPRSGAPLPTGEPGEIAVRGATLMRGYYKLDPEGSFDADGWLRTGDGGSLDEAGQLHWTGRLSTLIKTGGANVSPLEIEGALRSYPGLRAALAVGVPHPDLGEAVVLCALPADGAEPDPEEIRGFLRQHLAPYKVPRRVLFFRPDELSYTGNQKIQVGPLREAALARLAAEGAEIAGHRY
jgi:fatty-acyl-CoA synthase